MEIFPSKTYVVFILSRKEKKEQYDKQKETKEEERGKNIYPFFISSSSHKTQIASSSLISGPTQPLSTSSSFMELWFDAQS